MLDITNRIVSIDLAIAEVGAGLLCFSHAEKIVVPRGWTLVDNRSVRPPLFDGDPYEVAPPAEPLPPVDVAVPLAAAKRRDRKRRSPLPPTPSAAPSSTPDAHLPAASAASGSVQAAQFDLADRLDDDAEAAGPIRPEAEIEVVVDLDVPRDTSYDLPSAYREGSAVIDLDEPDRNASPLLARAFEVTRTKRR